MTLQEILQLAKKHINEGTMVSSAQLCLADARELQKNGQFSEARQKALKALRYLVGILHPDYALALGGAKTPVAAVDIKYVEAQLEKACPLTKDHEAIGQIRVKLTTKIGETNYLNITPRQLGLIEDVLLGVTK